MQPVFILLPLISLVADPPSCARPNVTRFHLAAANFFDG
jgi:hypothetical protein